jgi:hypothetical protein
VMRYCGIGVRPQSQKSFTIEVKEVFARPVPMRVAVRENWLPEVAQASLVSSLGEESA